MVKKLRLVFLLFFIIQFNFSVAKDFIRDLEKSCELGDDSVCFNLGVMYEYGQGVEKDYKKAFQLYKKACSLGYKNACEYVKNHK